MYCFYVVFLLDLKKNCWLFKMFFYMSLAMCNSKIVCDVICRHFFTFALFPSLGIEKSGVVDFFSTISTSCAQDESLKEMQTKISTILYREETLNFIDQCYY